MAPDPALLPVPAAVRALVDPPDHHLGCFAPAVSDSEASDQFEARAFRAQEEKHATVVTGEELQTLPGKVITVFQALLKQRNTIIVNADRLVTENCEMIESIDAHAAKNVGYLNLVFRSKDTLSAPYIEEAVRQNRCRRVLITPPRGSALCGQIMNLLDAQFGDVDLGRRAEFMVKVEELVQGATLDWAGDKVIERRSGLAFYPVPEGGLTWPAFAATQPRYSKDPRQFLLDGFAKYIECGLLYSGHLRSAHRELYDALRFSAVNSFGFHNVDAFFAAHGILIAADLADPSASTSLRVQTVLDINTALAGRRAVLGHVATHTKRSRARRAAVSAPGPA